MNNLSNQDIRGGVTSSSSSVIQTTSYADALKSTTTIGVTSSSSSAIQSTSYADALKSTTPSPPIATTTSSDSIVVTNSRKQSLSTTTTKKGFSVATEKMKKIVVTDPQKQSSNTTTTTTTKKRPTAATEKTFIKKRKATAAASNSITDNDDDQDDVDCIDDPIDVDKYEETASTTMDAVTTTTVAGSTGANIIITDHTATMVTKKKKATTPSPTTTVATTALVTRSSRKTRTKKVTRKKQPSLLQLQGSDMHNRLASSGEQALAATALSAATAAAAVAAAPTTTPKKKLKRAEKIEAGITRNRTSRRSLQQIRINYADDISSEEEEEVEKVVTKNKKAASFAGRKHNEESEEEDLNEYSEATDDDNKKTSNETTTTTINKNKKRLDTDEIRSSGNFFDNDPTQLQDLNKFRSTMVENWKSIKNEVIEIGGEDMGIIGNRINDHQDFKWFGEPMVDMVAGRPVSKNGSKKALIVGNYPKPTLCKRDNDPTGLTGMFEKVKEDAIDSEFRFRNPSIDQLRCNFGELVQSESVTGQFQSVACEVIEETFIAVDIFPFQCFYRANIPKLLDLLRAKFPVFYKSYIAYTKYEFESVSKALLRAGQKPSETPLLTLGTAPYEELTKERGHFHFLLKKFKYPVRTCHPCSLLDPSSTCGLPRFQESDEALTQVSRFITGNENMVITYHQRFYDEHEPTLQAVLERRLRTSFGGINESENQRNCKFGGINETDNQRNCKFGGINENDDQRRSGSEVQFGGINENDNQRNARKATQFTPDDILWSENLIRTEQYALEKGKVPKCIPKRLRPATKSFNAEEQLEIKLISWFQHQRKFYRQVEGSRAMSQWRKDKFRTSPIFRFY